MTKQIERAYRNNRRRSWLLVAAVVALAAVVVPIASGASEKTYTLLFPTTAATSPAAKTTASSPTASNQTLCAETAYTVTLILKNTAKTVSLGSAEITFPTSSVTLSGTPTLASDSLGYTLPATANATRASNKVSLRELSMPKGKQLRLTVSLTASTTATAASAVSAAVKQSNDFNDSAGAANTFENPSMPTITVERCDGTIEGRIWRDSDESRAQNGTEAGQSGWNVYLYDNGTQIDNVVTNGSGNYIFEGVALNKTYVVCEADPVVGSSWAQSTPLTEPAVCSANGHESAGHSFSFIASVTGKNFGNVNTVRIDCGAASGGGPTFTTATPDSIYTVKIAGGNLCTKSAEFVFEAYANGSTERVANLHPADPGATGVIHVLEKMEWRFAGSGQPDPANRSLKYDDTQPYTPVPMPYCLKDPRAFDSSEPPVPLFDLDPDKLSNVLPGTDTSCLIATTETAGTANGGTRVDIAYTSVDGYRAFP